LGQYGTNKTHRDVVTFAEPECHRKYRQKYRLAIYLLFVLTSISNVCDIRKHIRTDVR